MTAVEFISSAYAAAWTFDEQPGPITAEEAAVIIAQENAAGNTAPAYVTPALFAAVWNIYASK